MIKFVLKFLAVTLLGLSGLAQAATYYDSSDQCEAAWHAGKTVSYQPTGKHKAYGDARIAGFEKRALEGDACVHLNAQPGKRWVFLKQGTEVYTKGTDVKFLAECQNDIYQVTFLKKNEPAPVVLPPQNKVVQITETIQKDIILKENFFCEKQDGTKVPATITNGQPVCPTVTITAPVVVDEPIRVQPHVVQVSSPPVQPTKAVQQNQCLAGDCSKPHVEITRKVARTYGRCVLVLEHDGLEHFVRFDTTKATNLLVAARVSNANGDWVRTNPLGLVGDDSQTVKLDVGNQCPAAIAAFTSDRSFVPTAKRIGLPTNCKPKGQV